MFEEEDQSAYFHCLCLFVSAGKRMYLQHLCFKSICFPLEIIEIVFYVFFFWILELFVLSLFHLRGCSVPRTRWKEDARFTVVCLVFFWRNKQVWNVWKWILGKRTLCCDSVLKESEYLDLDFFVNWSVHKVYIFIRK